MKSGGIEDILIERGYETKKKKNTGIKVVIFLLIVVLALFIAAYYYFINLDKISAKELFITNISKTNFKALLQEDIYTKSFEKIETKDFETETNMSFTTTLKNDELENVDVSKITIDILNKNDVDNSKTLNEATLKYAENEVFKMRTLSNENSIAIFANEIQDKYIGCNYENLQKILGINYNNNLKKLKNVEKINISDEDKTKYLEKYFAKVMENIPEEKFTIQENIVIQKTEESVDVTAYSVKLNKEELNNLVECVLETLKQDKELLSKIAGKVEDVVEEENNIEQSDPILEENVEEPVDAEGNSEEPTEPAEETTPEEPVVEETNALPVLTINPVGTISPVEMSESEKDTVSKMGDTESTLNTALNDKTDLLYRLILGKKLDMSVKEIQDLIEAKIKLDEYYELTNGQDDKGLTVNVYASEEKTEKITIDLPNEASVDIEFVNNSEKDNRIKLTYLKKENNQRNGFALDFNKIQNEANTKIKATYSVIEDEKINKKIIVDLKTDGTVNSKEIKNDAVITISTDKGETKTVLDNIIKFKDVDGLEDLVPENCLYLDQLSEEELKITLDDLKNKFKTLYEDKKDSLNFINTNTGGITLEDISSAVNKEDAKNALITRVSNMMQEAIDNNQEFTIKNLENLTIDGYEVSSTVTEENAKIVVDIYTFNIDQNFTLTDSE